MAIIVNHLVFNGFETNSMILDGFQYFFNGFLASVDGPAASQELRKKEHAPAPIASGFAIFGMDGQTRLTQRLTQRGFILFDFYVRVRLRAYLCVYVGR